MNLRLVERLVNAVLYEGYILYPYRPSAVKNRQRFNFGALCPESYSVAQQGTEAWSMQTECLVRGGRRATIEVKARFLHLLAREVAELATPLVELREGDEPDYHPVEKLEIGDRLFQTWQEAVERDVSAPNLNLNDLVRESLRLAFAFPSTREIEPLRDASGKTVGVIVRKQAAIEGAIEVAAERAGDNLFKVSVRILNETKFGDAKSRSRDEALMQSLVSTHTILSVGEGEFVSLLDPPAAFRDAAAGCHNIGTWPVLVGEAGERDCLLSSPIILYDYPEIAPESPGDLFDGTEIDEILTLRILTLTEDEKRAMRGVDERARQILERTETMPVEQMMKMHGAMRSLHLAEEDER
ncbi:MAG: hypothetical protein V7641_376 [Blastocatellia bacterium]